MSDGNLNRLSTAAQIIAGLNAGFDAGGNRAVKNLTDSFNLSGLEDAQFERQARIGAEQAVDLPTLLAIQKMRAAEQGIAGSELALLENAPMRDPAYRAKMADIFSSGFGGDQYGQAAKLAASRGAFGQAEGFNKTAEPKKYDDARRILNSFYTFPNEASAMELSKAISGLGLGNIDIISDGANGWEVIIADPKNPGQYVDFGQGIPLDKETLMRMGEMITQQKPKSPYEQITSELAQRRGLENDKSKNNAVRTTADARMAQANAAILRNYQTYKSNMAKGSAKDALYDSAVKALAVAQKASFGAPVSEVLAKLSTDLPWAYQKLIQGPIGAAPAPQGGAAKTAADIQAITKAFTGAATPSTSVAPVAATPDPSLFNITE
jgi:hypothetical protein